MPPTVDALVFERPGDDVCAVDDVFGRVHGLVDLVEGHLWDLGWGATNGEVEGEIKVLYNYNFEGHCNLKAQWVYYNLNRRIRSDFRADRSESNVGVSK